MSLPTAAEDAESGAGSDEDAAAPAPREGEDYSGTNVQEEGVDEADVVKTDGERVLVAMNGELHLLDTSTAAPAIIESVTLPAGYNHELFLSGDRVLVIGEADPYAIEELDVEDFGDAEIAPYDSPTTMLVEVDISGEQSMEIVSTQFESSMTSVVRNGEPCLIASPNSTKTSPGKQTIATSEPSVITVTSAGNVSPTPASERLRPQVMWSAAIACGFSSRS